MSLLNALLCGDLLRITLVSTALQVVGEVVVCFHFNNVFLLNALLCGDLLRRTLVSTAGSSTISPRLELGLEWHCSAWQCVFVFVFVLVMHFS